MNINGVELKIMFDIRVLGFVDEMSFFGSGPDWDLYISCVSILLNMSFNFYSSTENV